MIQEPTELERAVLDLTELFKQDDARNQSRDSAFLTALEQMVVREEYLHTIRHDLMGLVNTSVGVLPTVLNELGKINDKLNDIERLLREINSNNQ